jgi:hypothetical protein
LLQIPTDALMQVYPYVYLVVASDIVLQYQGSHGQLVRRLCLTELV